MKRSFYKKGFTLIEMTVVIAIIGILAVAIFPSLNIARSKARDARRFSDMRQIQFALELYYADFGRYPNATPDACCGVLDMGPCGSDKTFISELETGGYINETPTDPSRDTACQGYSYYRYKGGSLECSGRSFYVLGIREMENRGHINSLGWKCGGRDWSKEFDWVAGMLEV